MKLYTIDTGYFKLDGGAMFGVVPKTLWQKLHPADENNMCIWALRCLLIEDGNRLILIDAGIGDFMNETYRSRYFPHGDDTLESSLAKHGFKPEDITDIILTHLHFDHCCGVLTRDENQNAILRFPNANIWTSYAQWQWANNPNPREKASFLQEILLPIHQSGKLKFLDSEDFNSDKIELEQVFGHTEAMLICHIYYNEKTITYCADLIPSHHHIRLPFVMAYDIRPLETMKEKIILLERAYENKHILFFEHDKDIEACTLKKSEKGIEIDNFIKIADI